MISGSRHSSEGISSKSKAGNTKVNGPEIVNHSYFQLFIINFFSIPNIYLHVAHNSLSNYILINLIINLP